MYGNMLITYILHNSALSANKKLDVSRLYYGIDLQNKETATTIKDSRIHSTDTVFTNMSVQQNWQR